MKEACQSHRACLAKFQAMAKGNSVLHQVNEQHFKGRKTATECLLRIFSTAKFLARQGLPFRGHKNSHSNFQQLLKLRTEDSADLQHWLEKKTTWTSHDIQNEILERMANCILRSVADEVRQRKLFAVLVDETADISSREQLCITVRTVSEDLEAEEMVLGLYALDKCDAQTITDSILDVFRRLDLSVQDLRGQCYDELQ